MRQELVRRQTPEEREVEKKKVELTALETALAERELDLATFQAELRVFETRYLRMIGVLYAELDEIHAQIAKAQSQAFPQNEAVKEKAEQSRERANESANTASAYRSDELTIKFKPSDDLKKLYRDLARKLHPDLATDPQEQARRHQIMIEINRAYEAGDAERLKAILIDWESNPQLLGDESIGAELIRLIRQIAQVEERIEVIDAEIIRLQESELAILKAKIEQAEMVGHDLLAEMAEDLRAQIVREKAKGFEILIKLRRKGE